MRGILLIILISLCIQSSYTALPFTCDNTDGLQADSALDSQFITTFNREYFSNDSVINIVVMKEASYDASNVKGIFFSVFGVETDGTVSTTSYGTFPVVTTANLVSETVNSPCGFITFDLWPGEIGVFWKALDTTTYPETIRLCVGIAVTESPILSGYLNCKDIRRAQAVTKPDVAPGHGVWDSSIDLLCMVTVFPAPEFNWYYNDVMIENDGHYLLFDTSSSFNGADDHQHTLSVRNSRTYDTIFNYHCSVTNVLQLTEVRSDNTVLTIGDLPLVLLESPDASINGFLEESLVLKCVFVSYPRPLIVWEKEGIRLDNTSEIVIIPGTGIEDSSGIIVNSRLAFSSLAHSDSGNFTCKAMRGGTVSASLDSPFALDIISASSITFITPDSIAIVGTYVTLNCQANGVPPPTIRWLNSAGMEIGTTSSISVRVIKSGANTWTCETFNPGGPDSRTVTITGYITAASIATPPGDTTVAYRDKASFVCVASGDPVPVVKWYFTETGGAEIELSGYEDVYDISESSLVIPKATLQEQGSYRCEATNIANTDGASATLTIQIVIPAVQITPASQDVIYNTAHTISCVSSGIPTSVNSITTPQDTKVSSPYLIESFNEGDVGLYRCVAVNPANGELAVQSATYSLTPLLVEVTPYDTSVDISSSSPLTLTCNVLGTPTYTSLTWYHKNPCSEELMQISGTESGISISPGILTIIPIHVTDFLSGEYICVADRFSIEFSGSAVLTVTSLTDTVTIDTPLSTYNCPDLSAALQRQFQCNAISTESNPVTYSWFLNQNRLDPGSDTSRIILASDGYGSYRCVATSGQICDYSESAVDGGLSVDIEYTHSTPVNVEDSITINCIAIGFPLITYSWSKDGTTIPGQTTSVYTIGAVTVLDTGVYTCSVDIDECTGVMTSSGVTINVIQTSPVISTIQGDIDVELGSSDILTCTGTGVPTPSYQWYQDSVPIQNAESNTYTITSASIADNGLYTCEVFSYVDRSFQEISDIYVYQAPIDIQITGQPMIPSEIGDIVVLTCSAVGIPAPDYQWFSNDDGLLISRGSRLEITVEMEAGFACLADNGRGIAQDSVIISIAPEPSNLLIILPVVLSVCAVILFCIMTSAVCLMWVYNIRRRRSNIKGEIAGDSNVLLADPPIVQDNDAQLEDSVSSKTSTSSITGGFEGDKVGKLGGLDRSNPLTIEQLQTVLSTVAKSGGFDGDNELNLDFESTPSNMARWTTMPKDSEIKNRYMNVLPNHDTMVELSDTGESGSTYINANFVTNYKSKKTAYIAAQGPLPSTIVDFWRMVWENDVSAVVMTCLLFERKRIRCARYWPDTQQRPTEIYGHFKVSIDSYAQADDHEVAMLYLVNLKAGPNEVQKKLVYHYWYKSWPTYGVPKETNKIWKFLEELNTTVKDSNKPILFHCSAGIGRTAVFIGIDMGMREFKSISKVDPLKYLCLLRKGRGGSIQTAEQYLYMHSVLSDFIKARSTTI